VPKINLLSTALFFRCSVTLCVFILGCSPIGAQISYDSLVRKAENNFISNSPLSISICDSLLENHPNTSIQKGILYRIKGMAFYFSGEYEKAGKQFVYSVNSFGSKSRKELGITYIEQAKLYRKLNMHTEAIDIYQKAFSIFQKLNDPLNKATVLNEWGVVYENQGLYSKAIDFYTRSLKLKSMLHDTIGMAFSNGFISMAFLLNKQLEKAEKYGVLALDLFFKTKNDVYIALQSVDLSGVYLAKKDYAKSIRCLNFSDSVANVHNYPDLKLIVAKKKAELYAAQSNFKAAYNAFQVYSILDDSLFKVKSHRNIAELYVQYKTAEKDRNLLMQKNTLNHQKFLLTLILSLLVIIIGLTVIVARNHKIKEKQLHQEAAHQKLILHMEAEKNIQQDRLRISRDLHDNIGSYLTFIKMNVEEFAEEPNENKEKLIAFKQLTTEAITELRRTVWLINKPSVNIEEWMIKLREYYKIYPLVRIEDNVQNKNRNLSALQATMLYRIIQEAVNNAIKYAQANAIVVRFEEGENGLKVWVKDDGIGFDIEKITPGFGIENMIHRAKEIKGVLEINSQKDIGTTLILYFEA
jgi:signal transduction histidine kinase